MKITICNGGILYTFPWDIGKASTAAKICWGDMFEQPETPSGKSFKPTYTNTQPFCANAQPSTYIRNNGLFREHSGKNAPRKTFFAHAISVLCAADLRHTSRRRINNIQMSERFGFGISTTSSNLQSRDSRVNSNSFHVHISSLNNVDSW